MSAPSTNGVEKVASEEPTEIKVIGAGLCLTGNTSLADALEVLGFGPCHSVRTIFQHPERSGPFTDAYDGYKMDWPKLMSGYNSTVDHPTTDFVPELMKAFPDASIILTVRDSPDTWWRSVESSVYRLTEKYALWIMYPNPVFRKTGPMQARIWPQMARIYEVPVGPEIYEKHNAWIRALVPQKKLLEFNVKEGWGPLCQFLNVPVPEVPFPETDEAAAFKKQFDPAYRTGMTIWAVLFGILTVLVGYIVQKGIEHDFWVGFYDFMQGQGKLWEERWEHGQ